MKKIAFILLLAFGSLAYANADDAEMMTTTSLQKTFSQMCEDVGGKAISLESYPVQEKCNFNGKSLSKESFKDKYDHYVLGIMVKYASEYKYSNAKNWKSYEEFLAADINDLKFFQEANLSQEIKNKIAEDIKIQEGIYFSLTTKKEIGQKNATAIEKALDKVMTNFQEKDHQNVYKTVSGRLDTKIKEMEYTQMVASFTPAGYKAFLLKLNAYRYLKILVDGRIE